MRRTFASVLLQLDQSIVYAKDQPGRTQAKDGRIGRGGRLPDETLSASHTAVCLKGARPSSFSDPAVVCEALAGRDPEFREDRDLFEQRVVERGDRWL
jgi:hypothetical protein